MLETIENLYVTVTYIVYKNEETGYCVMKTKPIEAQPGLPSHLTVVGVMPKFGIGEELTVSGTLSEHVKYGLQLAAEYVERVMPVTIDGMRRFLGSGIISNVGEKLADKLVDHFGLETINVLDGDAPEEKLQAVDGIGKERANAIMKGWQEQRNIADVMMFLQQYNISTNLATKIYRFYMDDSKISPINILKEDPYQLIRDISGVGFRKADEIARSVGIAVDAPQRMQAALIHAMNEASTRGHTYYPEKLLLDYANELLDEQKDFQTQLRQALTTLLDMGDLIADTLPEPDAAFSTTRPKRIPIIYRPHLYTCESGSSKLIARRMARKQGRRMTSTLFTHSRGAWQTTLEAELKKNDLTLTQQQQDAVYYAIHEKFSILTGGPGTGKTTTMHALIVMLDHMKNKYALAAPTGRAAKRLNQATGRDASTIHRLLGLGGEQYEWYGGETLPYDIVIIDEASMIDQPLFYSLIQAMDDDAHLLLVGDVDQLPSVGPGNVLKDLINSQICRVTRLNTIFRQSQNSMIVQNAHRINHGSLPLLNADNRDFFFFSANEPEAAADLLVDVVQNRIPQKFGYDAFSDIQVLAPMYRTAVGVNALNNLLQHTLNPPGIKIEYKNPNRTLRVGDKIMQTRNNYEHGVFNGDMGIIHSINTQEQEIFIQFEEQFIQYKWSELDDITLAYACSVHRSQGAEYPVVVMPIMAQHYMMLQRNLFYTAVTRARELVVLIGMRKAISIAVRNNKVEYRYTGLAWRLWEALMQTSNSNR